MYAVILAGGSGTRFWPVSRAALPKQLISVVDGPTMLQRTVERILPLKPKRLIVVTNALQADETERQLAPYRRRLPVSVVPEPVGRNTAPAIGLAASIIAAHDPQAVMAVLPADHFIRDEEGLRESLEMAAVAARNGYLVTLGIEPTRPETGYGYIEADISMRGEGPYPVARFVEKPQMKQALEYIEAGNYFWNSGMFVWRADVILEEISNHVPQLGEALEQLRFGGDVWDTADLETQIEAIYPALASQSIDYAVMEKSDKVKMVAADIGWSDVGSWSAIPEVVEAGDDASFVVNCAAHISVESTGCVISGNKGVVATIGVNDLVVVSSGDCVLVCPRERAQDVKLVVDQIKEKGLDRYL